MKISLQIILVVLFLLLGCLGQAQAQVLQKLRNEGSLVFYADYRSGNLNDRLTGLVPTITGTPVWTGGGLSFHGSTSRLAYASSAFTVTALSMVVLFDKTRAVNNLNHYEEMASVITLPATNRAEFAIFAGTQAYFQESQTGTSTWLGSKSIGISHTNGVIPSFYKDGVFTALGAAIITITAGDALIVGNYSGSAYQHESQIKSVLFFSKALSATEHAAVYAELQAMKWPTQPWTRFKLGAETAWQNWKTEFGARQSMADEGGTVGDYLGK